MLELLSQPPSDDALAAARGRVLAEHGTSRMIDKHLELFERLTRADRTEPAACPVNHG